MIQYTDKNNPSFLAQIQWTYFSYSFFFLFSFLNISSFFAFNNVILSLKRKTELDLLAFIVIVELKLFLALSNRK